MTAKTQPSSAPQDEDRKDPLTRKIDRNPCSKCRMMRIPKCKCGGGGGGDEGTNKEDSGKIAKTSPQNEARWHSLAQASAEVENNRDWAPQLQPNQFYNLEEVIELLSIQNDRENGILIIRGKVGLSTEEIAALQDLFTTIKAEFDDFKNTLEAQGIPVNNFTASIKGNELIIRIPHPTYYDAFIQKLASKNLLFTPNTEQSKGKPEAAKPNAAQQETNIFHPTPCPTTLKPYYWK